MDAKILQGDCLNIMPTLDADSVDSIITDPPYGLTFMGKEWDKGVPGEAFWQEALRVAKPGAHLLAFGGTRTHHRLACAIEDAGWEIRDCVMWVYGSGFPKSHNVGRNIDRALGAVRPKDKPISVTSGMSQFIVRHGGQAKHWVATAAADGQSTVMVDNDTPITELAKQWNGWGTALKPAWEPIIMARKPLNGTVAANVLAHGTGGINVDGCRVGYLGGDTEREFLNKRSGSSETTIWGEHQRIKLEQNQLGRWPANVIHDGSEEVVGLFPEGSFNKPTMWKSDGAGADGTRALGKGVGKREADTIRNAFGDSGSAARFFYCAKSSKRDRGDDNGHPTVKPTDLMRYLCRLVTPPGGVVLDPFMGSGSTGKAAMLEGFNFVGIELQLEYAQIAQARVEHAKQGATLKQ